MTNRTISRLRIFALVSGAIALSGIARAASLNISPINIDIPVYERSAGAVSIGNRGTAPVSLQIRIVRWRQEGGKQILEPTRDVIANPPAMTIPGEQTYTIRLARLSNVPLQAEESYRLLVDELPPPIDPNNPPQGVRMLLRTSLPIFFSAKNIAPKPAWTLTSANGRLSLRISNNGNRHIKLVDLAVEGPSGRITFNAAGIDGYVLPGATSTYVSEPLAAPLAPGTQMTITTAKGTPFEVREAVILSGT